jgi:hypothetical protein
MSQAYENQGVQVKVSVNQEIDENWPSWVDSQRMGNEGVAGGQWVVQSYKDNT